MKRYIRTQAAVALVYSPWPTSIVFTSTMPLPPIILSVAGSVLTAVKSTWELSRMLRDKHRTAVLVRAQSVARQMFAAYQRGVISDRVLRQYDQVIKEAVKKRRVVGTALVTVR